MLLKEELIKLSVEKAEDALLVAKDNIKMGHLGTAQNRIYYAIFYVVSALAYKNNFSTSKHKQLMGWFNKTFIHDKKVFDEKIIKIYKDSFTNRQKSDYEFTFMTDKESMEKELEKAMFFVDTVKEYIETGG